MGNWSGDPFTGVRPLRRLASITTQLFFTASLFVLLRWQGFTEHPWVSGFVAHFFGRSLEGRYQRVIDFYGPDYGMPLETALQLAAQIAKIDLKTSIDCGTGTGFAASLAASHFPEARVVGVDRSRRMLEDARRTRGTQFPGIGWICADTGRLPFSTGSADLVIAQNTMPFLREFGRVCRSGGLVIFADSSAAWVSGAARSAALRLGVFDEVVAGKAGIGFYLIARRAAAIIPREQ
jgi:SAM-dependent methyltransferase